MFTCLYRLSCSHCPDMTVDMEWCHTLSRLVCFQWYAVITICIQYYINVMSNLVMSCHEGCVIPVITVSLYNLSYLAIWTSCLNPAIVMTVKLRNVMPCYKLLWQLTGCNLITFHMTSWQFMPSDIIYAIIYPCHAWGIIIFYVQGYKTITVVMTVKSTDFHAVSHFARGSC